MSDDFIFVLGAASHHRVLAVIGVWATLFVIAKMSKEPTKTRDSFWGALILSLPVYVVLLVVGHIWFPDPQTVKVTAVNYQRGEYSATTKDPRLGWIKFTARCGQLGNVCPELGKHDASETTNLTQAQNIISQAEER